MISYSFELQEFNRWSVAVIDLFKFCCLIHIFPIADGSISCCCISHMSGLGWVGLGEGAAIGAMSGEVFVYCRLSKG